MYLDAVVRNYALVDVPEDKELRKSLEDKSLEELGEMYLKLKPELHTKADLLERERVIRGIEIALGHQEPKASQLRSGMYPRPDIRPLIIGTTFDRAKIRENIKITFIPLPVSALNFRTVSTAISAARWLGKRNTPVEMQQNAMLVTKFSSANSRQER